MTLKYILVCGLAFLKYANSSQKLINKVVINIERITVALMIE